MGELITDRGVLTGLAVAALAAMAARLSGTGQQHRRWPGGLVAAVAVAGSLLVADAAGQNLSWANPDAASALGAIGLAVAVLAVVATFVGGRHDLQARADATIALALVAVGLFASVPETDLLRLMFGPLLIVAVGVRLRWLDPLSPIGAGVVGSALAWLSLVGGTPRPASIFGAAACLLTTMVAVPPGEADRSRGWWRIALGALIVVGTASAGRRSSITAATIQAVAVLAAGLICSLVINRPSTETRR